MDILLPTLAGIGRMLPVHDTAAPTNVGANWSVDPYTVPEGRVLALDSAMVVCFSGLVPVVQNIDLLDSASVIQARLVRELPASVNSPTIVSTTVWVVEGWLLRFQIGGGDATTDMVWSFSGRLFDWMDVT